MKKRTAFFLAIILVLSNIAIPASASGGVPEWAEAYTDYVKYGQFFQESIDFLSSNVSIALHDMDADGIPELLITTFISVSTEVFTRQEETPNKTLVTANTVISFSDNPLLFMPFLLRSS